MSAEKLRGLGVSSGIVTGQVVVLQSANLPVVPVPVPPERIEDEIGRLEAARSVARTELQDLRNRTFEVLGETYAGIIDAQLLILEDPGLLRKTAHRIQVGRIAAAWALKEEVGDYLRKFETIADGAFRERGGDLQDVHLRLQRILRGDVRGGEELPDDRPLLVVAHSLGPSDTVMLTRKNLAGFATDVGGKTSHTAILAQALSVPAVVGLKDITQRVRTGEEIILDGESGTVTIRPGANDLLEAERGRLTLEERESSWVEVESAPARTEDGTAVSVQANIEFPQEVEKAKAYGAEGIGLYRSEFLFLSRSPELPSEEDHYRTYVEMAARMAPAQVTIRTLDLGGEKYFHDVLDAQETNPVLGLRAVRFCLQRQDIFRPQIRGLLRAAAEADIRIMIPLVTTADEIRQVKALIFEEAGSLRAAGIPCREDVPVGIMVEVPAAAWSADILALESDFFSIGTNDLIQYALAVDRSNEAVDYLYQPLHPAVLRMIKFIIESADRAGIPVSLCGEMAGDEEMTPLLVGLGLRELSVQPRAIQPVRRAIAGMNTREAKARAMKALDLPTALEIEEFLLAT
ncbi:MAG: phosphoenolpyruvate--protein phosphotransferase [Acidobacteria bacterium]|uniref:Phosphoenolpyruvate-protein phosphotransferase n=1 Tax=Candidatus Polarisedimenticola svalbardensis TaxID=2886004 RepID=A0A8J6Y6F0_9BACT|nr:phosphoenolpyruvate--protein phosphotransferase [Candidatus Polarisedimenticola svalbardensis]